MDIDFSKYSAPELYEIARNYQIKKDTETAIKIYESIIQDFPGSMVADDAKNEIKVIMLTDPPRRPYVVEPVIPHSASSSSGSNNFPALKTISMLFKVLAGVNFLGGGAISTYFMNSNNTLTSAFVSMVTLFSALLCWAAAEVLMLFMAIERNTRKD